VAGKPVSAAPVKTHVTRTPPLRRLDRIARSVFRVQDASDMSIQAQDITEEKEVCDV